MNLLVQTQTLIPYVSAETTTPSAVEGGGELFFHEDDAQDDGIGDNNKVTRDVCPDFVRRIPWESWKLVIPYYYVGDIYSERMFGILNPKLDPDPSHIPQSIEEKIQYATYLQNLAESSHFVKAYEIPSSLRDLSLHDLPDKWEIAKELLA